MDTCGMRIRPHIEVCRDINAAVAYRDMPEKGEAWARFGPSDRAPRFFRIDPLGVFEGKGRKQGFRTDVREALASTANYEELVLEHPEVAMRGRHIVLDYFRLRDKSCHRDSVP